MKANSAVDAMTFALLREQVVTVSGSENYAELRYPTENKLFWESRTPQETRILLNAGRTILEICQVKIDARSRATTNP